MFHLLLATEAAAVPRGWWRTLRGLSQPISMAPCTMTRTNGVYEVFFLFRGRIQRWSTQVTLSPVFICNHACVFFGSCSSFVIGSACWHSSSPRWITVFVSLSLPCWLTQAFVLSNTSFVFLGIFQQTFRQFYHQAGVEQVC